ncbi:hypothetical protein FC19_GL001991 [Liquorilactobacillus aquaticus DSM 21051]|uniref:Uncharacterized protein n=1 Tax=Liquorilactobacillus aquaticus DSM 21051 TaxID=1423725 RepID=A0A0R2D0G9_9LACO|nr:glycosyltransferase 87 family protein [Liquorilactobacillus aquaticus]KRM95380.1 hypothetical protein FC19_GL001991 [Liquorilactobacillus aquaticus DSM 21051]
MTNIEKKIIRFIDSKKIFLLGVVVTVLAIIIRLSGINFVSGDASWFLLPWFREIKQEGLLSLGKQVGDYNIPYQTIIAFMTYLPFKPLYMYKWISIFFDFALAISSGLLVLEIKQKRSLKLFTFTYSAVLMLPTVIWNSSFWGQCDSIFVTFAVLAVLFLHKNKVVASFIFLGLAFSFKLQTIFIVPFYIYVYLIKKNYSIFNFLIIPFVMYVMCIPGFIFGRTFTAPFEIYTSQTNTYHNMQMNFMNLWAMMGGNRYDLLKGFASMLTIFILGIGLVWLMGKRIDLGNDELFLTILVWTVWTCVMFLPSMHDRYAYMLDIFLVISVFKNKKFVLFAAISVGTSMLEYSPMMFGSNINPFEISVCYLATYLFFTYNLVKKAVELGADGKLENENYESKVQR